MVQQSCINMDGVGHSNGGRRPELTGLQLIHFTFVDSTREKRSCKG